MYVLRMYVCRSCQGGEERCLGGWLAWNGGKPDLGSLTLEIQTEKSEVLLLIWVMPVYREFRV